MAINNINWNALDKFNGAATYAQDLKNNPRGGGDVVVYLQNGDELDCQYSQTDAPKSLTCFSFSRTNDEIRKNNETRAAFKQAVIDIFGTRIEDVPKKVRDAMNLSKFDNAGRPLTARRILAVNKAIYAEFKPLAKKLGITGGAAGEIVSAVARNSGLMEAEDPALAYKTRANRHATASIATHIASCATTDMGTAQFDVDIRRGMDISLGGKRIKTRDPNEAHDKIVQFITGRKNATFDSVDEPTRRKAYILMSLMHQGAFGSFMTAAQYAFDAEGKVARLNASSLSSFGGRQTASVAVTKDKAGNITVKGVLNHSGRLQVSLNLAPAKVSDVDGAYCKTVGVIKLPADNLEKLAAADWTQLDYAPIGAMDTNYDMPDRFTEAANMLPDKYKFTGTVEVSMKTCVNSLHGMDTLG